jgi:hypothetical protein
MRVFQEYVDFEGDPLANHGAYVLEIADTSWTLKLEDNGKILRFDANSAVTVTVPRNLPKSFNCAIAQWGTGDVAVTAGTGATNRSVNSGISEQYGVATLVVMRNVDNNAAEYILRGDVE